MSTKPSLFVDGDQTTLIMAEYLNDLRTLCYELAGDGTNAPSTVAQARANLAAAKTGVNTDITSLASGLVLAGAPALDDSSLKVATTGWAQVNLAQTREGGSVGNIQLFAETVGNSLRISLVDPAGAALSATNPGLIGFISDYGSSDQLSFETITSPLLLTVPAGATLGMVSGAPARLWVLAIKNAAGDVALAVQNCVATYGSSGNEGGYILSVGQASPSATASSYEMTSTTAISGSATGNAVYAANVYSNRAFTVIGCIDITCPTAGTWTGVSPSSYRTNPPFRPGEQRADFQLILGGEEHSASEVIPDDTSIPQTSEGFASGLVPHAYAYPGCAPDWVEVTVRLGLSTAAAALVMASLHRATDSGNVRAAARASQPAASGTVWTELTLFEPRNTLSHIIYTVRYGASTAVVVTLNGAAAAGKLGGSMNSRVRVRSISA